MYKVKSFEPQDQAAAHSLMAEFPFATLMTVVQGTAPYIDHIPLLTDVAPDGKISLFGHFAKANPHAVALRQGGLTTAVFHGPHAYISPRWYEAYDVPTWNYAVVHATGPVRIMTEASELVGLMQRLVDHFDAPLGPPAGPLLPDDLSTPAILFKAIVGFELKVETTAAKFKMSQNRGTDDRIRVVKALASTDDWQSQAVAAWMKASLPPRA